MNASEAREKTENNIRTAVKGQYSNVKDEIEEAVSLKHFSVNHYGTLREEVVLILRKEGYLVSSQAGKPGDENETVIKW